MANTLEQNLENCITFPPLPQKPSITEQFFANLAVYSAIISGVTDHQPIYIILYNNYILSSSINIPSSYFE